jgi:hypothetical protein
MQTSLRSSMERCSICVVGEVEGGGGAATDAHAGRREAPQCPEGMMYDDFDPLLLQQKAALTVLEFATFDAALDEFYSKARCMLLHLLLQICSVFFFLHGLWRGVVG